MTAGLKSSTSFHSEGATGVRPLASSSSFEMSLMLSAWVEHSQRDEFEKELNSLSGKGLKSVALRQDQEKDIDNIFSCISEASSDMNLARGRSVSESTSSFVRCAEKSLYRVSRESKRMHESEDPCNETKSTCKMPR